MRGRLHPIRVFSALCILVCSLASGTLGQAPQAAPPVNQSDDPLLKPFQWRSILAHPTLVSCLIARILAVTEGQSPMNEGTGSVTGRVTIDGGPLPGISVTLRRADEDSATGPLRSPLRATTDTDGRYLFTGIPTGRYAVVPFAPGYLFRSDPLNDGARVVTVEDGEAVTGIDFALVKGGVITGRITYADGRPLIGERPDLMRFDERHGKPSYFSPRARRSFTTDDRGVYRFYGLPAGRYTVSVGVDKNRSSSGVSTGPFLIRTFYPSVIDKSEAWVIEVTEGRELSGIDITIGGVSRSYSASGRVVEAETGLPVANVSLGFTLSGSGSGVSTSFTPTGPGGEFHLGGILPGQHTLSVMTPSDSDRYTESVHFEVTDKDVYNIEVKLVRGAQISGTLVIDGISPVSLAGLSPFLEVSAGARSEDVSEDVVAPHSSTSKVSGDGAFHLGGLQEGTVFFGIEAAPDHKQIEFLRVEWNGLEQPNGIPIRAGERLAGVRLVIAYAAGVIRGRVTVEGGTLPEGTRMFGYAESARNLKPFIFRVEPVDLTGRFVMRNLLPGDYEVTVNIFRPGDAFRLAGVPLRVVTVTNETETEVDLRVDVSQTKRQ